MLNYTRKAMDQIKSSFLLKYAKMTGFLNVLDTDYLPTTLSASLLAHGVLCLTLELGESFVVNEKNVEYGLNSIWNIRGV